MRNYLVSALLPCGLFAAACASPACAQNAAADIAKAQQTVTEIARLLDGIAARNAGVARNIVGGSGSVMAPSDAESLFDGVSLGGWKKTDFRGGGAVHVEPGFRGGPSAIVVDAGTSLSGITWTKDMPRTNYEISLESMKIEGLDFMCGLTFPVAASHASLILGGWGGNVVGISSLDDHDASENETTQGMPFAKDHWYKVRMRVTPAKLEAWLDDKKIVDVSIAGKKVSLRFGEISKSTPLGLATYQTKAAYRNIKLHRLAAK